MKFVALILAKAESSRLPNKNFRDFHNGKSLLDIKIEQCMKAKSIDAVYVSSEKIEIREKVESKGAIFVPRSSELCAYETPWSRVVRGVLDTVPEDEKTFIVWCPATNPLFKRFDDVVLNFREESSKGNNSVTTVTSLNSFYLDSRFLPINHQWGSWHSYSQNNYPIYHLNWACTISSKKESMQCGYQIGSKPSFYVVNEIEGLDIDTPNDFDLARYRHTAPDHN